MPPAQRPPDIAEPIAPPPCRFCWQKEPHSHSQEEMLRWANEWAAAINEGRPYGGPAGSPGAQVMEPLSGAFTGSVGYEVAGENVPRETEPEPAPVVEPALGTTEREIFDQAKGLLNVYRDPAAAAKHLAKWLGEKYPKRIATSYWLVYDADDREGLPGKRDKGIDFQLYKLPWDLRVGALIGSWSAGIAVTKEVLATGRVRLAVGAGVVAPYVNLGDLRPAFTVRLSL